MENLKASAALHDKGGKKRGQGKKEVRSKMAFLKKPSSGRQRGRAWEKEDHVGPKNKASNRGNDVTTMECNAKGLN